MRARLLASLLAAAIPAAARAQSSLPGAAARAAAQHAVDATDAHTIAMSGPAVTAADAPVARPGAAMQSRSTKVTAAAPATTPTTRAPIAGRGVSAPVPAARDTAHAAKGTMTFSRETFSYTGVGRRDPFMSLLRAGGDLRPVLSDLRLVTIVYDASGRNSVAILRDLTTKEQYRVRAGQTLGRMRVAQIQPRQIVFTIDEFGYSRQETLMYNDPNTMRPK